MAILTAGRRLALAVLAVLALAARTDAQPYFYALGIEPLTDRQQLNVVSATTHVRVAAIVLGRTQGTRPEHMVMAPDGTRIYVINNWDFTVSVVSTGTHALVETWPQSLVGNSPQGLAVSPDGRRVHVTNLRVVNGLLEGYLVVVDVASRTQVTTIDFGARKPYGVVSSPDGTRLYVVTSTDAGNLRGVTVLDTASYAVIAEVPLSTTAFGTTITLSPDGRFAYLARQPNSSQTPGIVDVLDTTSNMIVATTTVPNNPRSVAVSPSGATVYVAIASNSGSLQRLDPITHASLGAITMPVPIAVAFSADGAAAYVAAVDRVIVVSTTTHAVTATIPIPSRLLDNSVGNRIAAIVATPPPHNPPGSTPSDFRAATIVGNRVTFTWKAPSSVTPTGYVIEGGITPQQVAATVPTGSTSTAFTLDVPTGAFFVRARALTANGPTGSSNEIRILVNLPQVPSPPAALLGLAAGTDLALSWTNTSTGGPPQSLVLDVVGTVTASLPLPLSETFMFVGVPAGTYTFALRAVNDTGTSSSSPAVTLTFPNACPGMPQVPQNLSVTRTGPVLTVSWDPPAAGPAVSSYILRVSGAISAAVPLAGRTISGAVPPGTYNLSVVAVNPCGVGTETVVQSIVVP